MFLVHWRNSWKIFIFVLAKCSGQINRPPEFLKGGDMDNFSLKEDTAVGTYINQNKIKNMLLHDMLTVAK